MGHSREAQRRDPLPSIDAETLASAIAAGADALRRQADAINAINVFPVPDGDTGTNMSLTMRAAVEAVDAARPTTAAGVLKAAADGALMGAKGNSGVILSQVLAGMSAANPDCATLDGSGLASGLERARESAYRIISNPKEGTILTAVTDASGQARACADAGEAAESVLEAAARGAKEAVARTPELLPVLKEAGVVDAGAEGFYVLLDGMVRRLRGEASAPPEDLGAIDPAWLAATTRMHDAGERAGFCTEFVVTGEDLDAAALRSRLLELGDSVLVTGGDGILRAHVHTKTPDDALTYARTLGVISHEKVDDMEAQFRALAAASTATTSTELTDGVSVVAVAPGEGIGELFRSVGVAQVVSGGQTMNPSAGDIRAAIEACNTSDVIVLPNNKNIILAAKQAAGVSGRRVHVVETRSVPQGVAAAVALNPEAPAEDNVMAMIEAAGSVRTAEVTLAARATSINGVSVRRGQPIALVDGELAVAEDTVPAAVRACVARMVDGRTAPLVTLFAGEGESLESAEHIAAGLRDELGVEVEVVAGGQPHYPYLVGVE